MSVRSIHGWWEHCILLEPEYRAQCEVTTKRWPWDMLFNLWLHPNCRDICYCRSKKGGDPVTWLLIVIYYIGLNISNILLNTYCEWYIGVFSILLLTYHEFDSPWQIVMVWPQPTGLGWLPVRSAYCRTVLSSHSPPPPLPLFAKRVFGNWEYIIFPSRERPINLKGN